MALEYGVHPVSSSSVASVDAALEQLSTSGYCVLRAAVPEPWCDTAIAAFRSWVTSRDQPRGTDGRLPRIVNLHLELPELARLFTIPDVLSLQDRFFESEAVLYTSLYYEHGSAQPFHRDAPYFSTRPREHTFLGVWFALEDTDATNGPLSVIESGHRMEAVDRYEVARRHFTSYEEIPPISDALWVDYQDSVTRACRERRLPEHELHVRRGDVIAWHPLTPHMGSPILDTSRTRHSIVMHTIPTGTSVYHGDVYFNPNARPEPRGWGYRSLDGRSMVDHGSAAFG